jgi:hypothetical protein
VAPLKAEYDLDRMKFKATCRVVKNPMSTGTRDKIGENPYATPIDKLPTAEPAKTRCPDVRAEDS